MSYILICKDKSIQKTHTHKILTVSVSAYYNSIVFHLSRLSTEHADQSAARDLISQYLHRNLLRNGAVQWHSNQAWESLV